MSELEVRSENQVKRMRRYISLALIQIALMIDSACLDEFIDDVSALLIGMRPFHTED